ncbi:DEAD/DEAH box helicase [Purpureocillium lilacinum]|uniref:RNA helicase n=1 Tax=Purpureocillium lilacinum TaxID=33203 RepID=A0A179H4A6_PURLI|nr:DEAD/DEAH box helicase [Purpureocillium lilacinum]OAQ84410.1 DEAD/DEAH box helicase [Purpureocillium lilacinum]OAQ91199.1 DEAD/DEAH box helicase [Purpureocillium lilacinum]PWI74459.1 pre-mRNA-splicing ATP-dependent RNA helicase PRP28 [Purpureocillium lilacinum]GJN68691.1 mRNA splicing protein prp28 [Purpureocillium lilacinum]GJN77632.1 mRNA splicing protein prp28 [Purpureocillium lilacinum]
MPLDLEKILQEKKAADAAAARPRFIPRAERERLAAEKLKKEESEKKRKAAEQERKRRDDEKKWESRSNGSGSSSSAVPTGPRSMNQQGDRDRDRDRERERDRDRDPKGSANKPSKGDKRSAEDIEAALLRARYLGPEVNKHSNFSAKKKRMRTTEKKFNFEWDPDDDTSRENDPLYSQQTAYRGYSFAGVGGEFDEDAERRARKRARMIEERDLEFGKERAKGIMEDFYRARDKARERAERTGLGRHWSEKRLEEMRERDWRIFKEDFGISTKGGSIPNPMRNWDESGLPPRLLDIVDRVGYKDPSPIQRAAIPIALQARDLIGVAVTGSGKTAAFLLPLLVYISDLPPMTEVNKNDGPYALILAPTRELVQQIETEALKFATPLGFRCVSIVGGHSLEEQAYALRNGAEIVVATPGRLVDCIERRLLVLGQCCYVIMDEADRMVDLGFEESVNKILDALPVSNEKPDTDDAENAQMMKRHLGGRDKYRQTMMYTATMPPVVERIAKKYLRRPAIATIGNAGEAVDTVEQRVELISGEDRRKRRLQEILASKQFAPPIIVFVNIKRNCDAVARDIKSMGYSAVTLHGSKTQEQREAALGSVRSGQTQVLVATDLAGRGIDVPDVSLVINFNMATSIESYTHRIGRTGRAGKSGVAITFLGNEDADVMYDLKQMLSKSSISKVPEELRRHEAAQSKPVRGGASKRDTAAAEKGSDGAGKGGWQ